MGARYSVICIKCDEQFEVNEGGGFFFHLVHCNIDAGINRFAGSYRCGGEYQLEAWARCPKCGSTDYNLDGPVIMYD